MSSKRIICVGCAFWDTIFKVDAIPGHGTKVLPEDAVQAASGMATAAAATIARLGGEVDLWTRIGDDATADAFIRDLEAEGLPTRRIRRIANSRTPFSTILVDRNGERLVVPFTDPDLDRDAGWLPLDEIKGSRAVLADVRWVEGARAALSRARSEGVATILDADIADVDVLRLLIPLADHVLFSEPALSLVTSAARPRVALLQVASRLDALIVGVTLGEQGALVRCREDPPDILRHFRAPRIRAVDTLNAGDVWHGAYAFGLANDWSLERTVAMANVAAAMKCERFGGRLGSPRLAELLQQAERWADPQAAPLE